LPTLGHYILGAQTIHTRKHAVRREVTFFAKRAQHFGSAQHKRRYAIVASFKEPSVLTVQAFVCGGRGQRRMPLGAVFGNFKIDDWEVYRGFLRNQFLKDMGWRIDYDPRKKRIIYTSPQPKF